MFGLLGSLFTGGAGLLGSIFSSNTSASNNAANIQMQQQTNQMQIEEAARNREFQAGQSEIARNYNTQMSNTAYQRASQDMKEAGLNPMMMFGSGSAASTPSSPVGGGSQAQLTAPQARENPGRPFEALGDIASKAVGSAVQIKTMDKMSDEMANLQVENERLRKLTEQVSAATATERERAQFVSASTKNVEQETLKNKLDRARQEWEAIKYLDLSNIPDVVRKTGNITAWGGQKISDAVSPLASSAGAITRLLPRHSTSQRSRVDNSGRSFDEFWENRTGFGR